MSGRKWEEFKSARFFELGVVFDSGTVLEGFVSLF